MANGFTNWLQNPMTQFAGMLMAGADPNRQALGGLGGAIMGMGQNLQEQSRYEAQRAQEQQMQDLQTRLTQAKIASLQAGPDWQQKYQWALNNPEQAQQLSQWGLIGGKAPQSYTFMQGQGAPAPGTEQMYEMMGREVEDRIGAYREEAKTARSFQDSLNRFSMSLEQFGDTGKQEPLIKSLREMGQMIGVPVDESKLADAQAVDQAAKMMVAEQLRQNKGPQTDFDARFASEYMNAWQF